MEKYGQIDKQLALVAFQIGAFKIRPTKPFTWAAGWKSPIYNDNRRLLNKFQTRELVQKGFGLLLQQVFPLKKPIIAGIATAGIPHGAILAANYRLDFIYIREKAKDHGMENQIEGIDAETMLTDEETVPVEDLISTGKSSVAGVQAARNRGAAVNHCFCIFDYGFPVAKKMFAGKIPFRGDEILSSPCEIHALFNYDVLLEVGIENGYIKEGEQEFLTEWRKDPEKWSQEWIANHS